MKAKDKAKGNGTSSHSIVGREPEQKQIEAAIALERNLLIEGPVGVGKTFLVQQALRKLGREVERVDGDTRYTEAKLTGWFDPPLVLKKGYVPECFIAGPLVEAMRAGKVLFINELNRMPEAVQNILLPAMDERRITVPRIGEITAKPGFVVVATQNPREFTATHALSEALLDRFEMIRLAYQSREEEVDVLAQELGESLAGKLQERAVDVARATRAHASVKRGASVRAAIAVGRLVAGGIDFETACLMALPPRIELVSSEDDAFELVRQLVRGSEFPHIEKKKDLMR